MLLRVLYERLLEDLWRMRHEVYFRHFFYQRKTINVNFCSLSCTKGVSLKEIPPQE